MLYYNQLGNECAKLRTSRAFLPYVPHILYEPTCSRVFVPLPLTCLPFCVPYVTSFYVPTFFYVPCVPSLFTAWRVFVFFYVLEVSSFFYVLDLSSFLYVLHVSSFFLRAWRVFIFVRASRVFIFYVLDVPLFFCTYFTRLHFLVPYEPPFFTCLTCLHTEAFTTEVLEVATKFRTNVII